jgi:Protein of unknown function (DUF3293).
MPGISGCLSPIFVSIPNFGLVRAGGVNRGMGRANIGVKESITARGNIGMKETESVSITEISAIAPELLAIYRASEYRVEDADPPFVMYVDQPCLDLALFMKRHGAQRALFISAWNPASLPRSEAENQAAQEDLEANLKTWGYRVFHGIGEDPMGGCPGEPCLLVLDWPEKQVLELARDYGQNAVICAEEDGIPRLRLTR